MPSATFSFSEYQISPRVTLRPGDQFKATGGPYYLTAERKKVSIGSRGVFKFVEVMQDGAYVAILARSLHSEACELIYVGKKRRGRCVKQVVLMPHKIRRVKG